MIDMSAEDDLQCEHGGLHADWDLEVEKAALIRYPPLISTDIEFPVHVNLVSSERPKPQWLLWEWSWFL